MISLPIFIARAAVTVGSAVILKKVTQNNTPAITAVPVSTDYVIVKNPNGNGTEVRIPILKVVGK